LILPALQVIYRIIAKSFQPGRTVVAAPGFAFGARIAQEKLAVPLATVHLQPIMLRSAIRTACFGFPNILGHLPPPIRKLYFRAADRFLLDGLLADQTNAFRAELGLRPIRRFFNGWIHSPQQVIGFFPEWLPRQRPIGPQKSRSLGFHCGMMATSIALRQNSKNSLRLVNRRWCLLLVLQWCMRSSFSAFRRRSAATVAAEGCC
jgi:rhamnosyltransferase subunit B